MIVVGWIFFGISVLIALANLAGAMSTAIVVRMGADRGYSSIPLISLLCSLLAWVFGKPFIGVWAFIPAALDPGTWAVVLAPFARFLAGHPGERTAQQPEAANSRPAKWLMCGAAWILGDEISRKTALHQLGPLASQAFQRQYIVDGKADAYVLPTELIDGAYTFVHHSRSSVWATLQSVRDLDHALVEIVQHASVLDTTLSNETLVEENPQWGAARDAAKSVLQDMGANFRKWERRNTTAAC